MYARLAGLVAQVVAYAIHDARRDENQQFTARFIAAARFEQIAHYRNVTQ